MLFAYYALTLYLSPTVFSHRFNYTTCLGWSEQIIWIQIFGVGFGFPLNIFCTVVTFCFVPFCGSYQYDLIMPLVKKSGGVLIQNSCFVIRGSQLFSFFIVSLKPNETLVIVRYQFCCAKSIYFTLYSLIRKDNSLFCRQMMRLYS